VKYSEVYSSAEQLAKMNMKSMIMTMFTIAVIIVPVLTRPASQLLQCRSKKDLVVLIDGSGSVRSEGWKVQLKAVRMLIEAFKPSPDSSDMGIIVYSGPPLAKTDPENVVKDLAGLDVDLAGLDVEFKDLNKNKELNANLTAKFPSRTTFTSKALAAVESELNMGQKDAEAVVVVMTDGYPADKKGTAKAAKKLNKKAKVIWVPITKHAPLKEIRKWATDPENVIPVKEFKDLNVKLVNDIVGTACVDLAPIDPLLE